jgi:hypothetical protein
MSGNRKVVVASVILLLASLLALAVNAEKKAKTYETGKLLDVSTEQRSHEGTTRRKPLYFLTVQIADIIYVGRYRPRSYEPSDFVVGDPVQARVEENHMYLKRPNGKDEIKTDIIKRERVAEKR